jgi:hypothetical protein
VVADRQKLLSSVPRRMQLERDQFISDRVEVTRIEIRSLYHHARMVDLLPNTSLPEIVTVTEIPKNPVGKIDNRVTSPLRGSRRALNTKAKDHGTDQT